MNMEQDEPVLSSWISFLLPHLHQLLLRREHPGAAQDLVPLRVNTSKLCFLDLCTIFDLKNLKFPLLSRDPKKAQV